MWSLHEKESRERERERGSPAGLLKKRAALLTDKLCSVFQ